MDFDPSNVKKIRVGTYLMTTNGTRRSVKFYDSNGVLLPRLDNPKATQYMNLNNSSAAEWWPEKFVYVPDGQEIIGVAIEVNA